MIKETEIMVKQKVNIIVCDRCGAEIVDRTDILQKVKFIGIGLVITEYKQCEWNYDCCKKRMIQLIKQFTKEK